MAGKTLYSDALVEPGRKRTGFEPENSMDDPSGLDHGYSHLYLDTLLGDKKLSVDINRYERFLSFRVNGLNLVIISDGIAKDGVIQVPDHVLIPPHMHDRNPNYDKMGLLGKERMTLEDLRERMQPYIDVEKEEKLEL